MILSQENTESLQSLSWKIHSAGMLCGLNCRHDVTTDHPITTGGCSTVISKSVAKERTVPMDMV